MRMYRNVHVRGITSTTGVRNMVMVPLCCWVSTERRERARVARYQTRHIAHTPQLAKRRFT
jgi:hypothetical protein